MSHTAEVSSHLFRLQVDPVWERGMAFLHLMLIDELGLAVSVWIQVRRPGSKAEFYFLSKELFKR